MCEVEPYSHIKQLTFGVNNTLHDYHLCFLEFINQKDESLFSIKGEDRLAKLKHIDIQPSE